ncbi:hypothetical protein TSAR_001403, partial [Trichomalopsis sarcophagae]
HRLSTEAVYIRDCLANLHPHLWTRRALVIEHAGLSHQKQDRQCIIGGRLKLDFSVTIILHNTTFNYFSKMSQRIQSNNHFIIYYSICDLDLSSTCTVDPNSIIHYMSSPLFLSVSTLFNILLSQLIKAA